MLKTLKKITESPWLRIIIGCLVVFIAIQESDGVIDEILAGKFHIHHGVMLLGLSQILQAIPDLFSGLEYLASSG